MAKYVERAETVIHIKVSNWAHRHTPARLELDYYLMCQVISHESVKSTPFLASLQGFHKFKKPQYRNKK